jgi:hypothetical protein
MVLVISINVYKSIKTLEVQLESIKTFVRSPFIVILNCNNYMYEQLSQKVFDGISVYINPEIIEKERFHGSLTKGIVSNMLFALKNFDFEFFIILSGRTIFYRNIEFPQNFSNKYWTSLEEMQKERKGQEPLNDWHWPIFKHSAIAKYYLNNNFKLANSAHEGLCFSKTVCKTICSFLQKQEFITMNLFNFNACVEEFALQTIASNEYDKDTLEYGFMYIGNGSGEDYDLHNFTRKIHFID